MHDINVQYSTKAINDLDRIWDYTEELWSADQAERYIRAIRQAVFALGAMPSMAQKRFDISPELRMHPVGKHWVFFEATNSTLTVIRILGQRQDWRVILLD